MVGANDPFWNYIEYMADDRMKCSFCPHTYAIKTSISRIKWHLSGEERRGVAICRKVTKEVQEEALKAMRGGNKRHRSTTSSINVNDHGISTCPQEQNIENENMGGDIGRVQREDQVVEAGVGEERISSYTVAGNDILSMTGMRAQEDRVSEGALESRHDRTSGSSIGTEQFGRESWKDTSGSSRHETRCRGRENSVAFTSRKCHGRHW